ncbi:MAG: acyl carrier protein [Candidatus Binatia bacterium]
MRVAITEVFAAVFRRPAASFAGDVSPATVEGWDSARHVELVVALEDRFGCMFDPDDVAELTTLGRIEEILRRYGCE